MIRSGGLRVDSLFGFIEGKAVCKNGVVLFSSWWPCGTPGTTSENWTKIFGTEACLSADRVLITYFVFKFPKKMPVVSTKYEIFTIVFRKRDASTFEDEADASTRGVLRIEG
jgi:hypothetical protein